MNGIGTTETRFFTFGSADEPFVLADGETIGPVTLAYEQYGELNASRDNAILVFHALTGSQHAAGITPAVPGLGEMWTDECQTGWWDGFVGPGKALDTDRYAVICVNYLGGCYGSTGPSSTDPATGRPYGSRFPQVSLADVVDSQVVLLRRHLRIGQLHAVIGGSVGGLMCISLATRYPELVRNVIPIAAGLHVTPLQYIHNFEQINAILNDPHFGEGDYYDGPGPNLGLSLARMIGHKTFVSLRAMEERARREVIRAGDSPPNYQITHPMESYMWHQGQKFVRRFDANTYLLAMRLWQQFDLVRDAGGSSVVEVLKRCQEQRFMVFSIDSDVCFYPDEQEEMMLALKEAGVPSRRITVHSEKGHDSFLLEPEFFTPHLRHTLEEGW